MARSDFESLIAPKPVVRKIERYKRHKGLPSRSQALASIIAEVERDEKLKGVLQSFLNLLRNLLDELKKQGNDKISQLIQTVLDSMIGVLKSAAVDLT